MADERANYLDRSALRITGVLFKSADKLRILGAIVDADNGLTPKQLKVVLSEARGGTRVPDSTVYSHINGLVRVGIADHLKPRSAKSGDGIVVPTALGRQIDASLIPFAQDVEKAAVEPIVGQFADVIGSLSQERQAEVIARLQAMVQTPKTS